MENKHSLKYSRPKDSRLFESDKEIRFDIPCETEFDNLSYIGVVLHETWHVPNHHHEHFELCYVECGEGWFTIDGSFYKVSQGDLFLTKPGESHQGAAAGDLPFRLYYLGFNLELMRSLEAEYYKIGFNRVEKDEKGLVKSIFDNIFEELRMKIPLNDTMVQGLFIQLLVSIVRIYNASSLAGNQESKKLTSNMIDILNYLHADFRADLTIEDLANKFHISRSHLAREFKQHLGVPIGEYIRSLCLDKAKHLLRETGESVSSIAARLHFTSIHTFSIFFKRHSGKSPLEFRKQNTSR
ncbi:AraC family transcriptional regulator [Paenibacillus nasutitermitis]|uniref:HTH-type transcriptional activator RhaS n=1 Tax=Paenibacillus nasutitermitis TaxID=1652958 RepID=A0A916Z8K3_9BACL|nr:AraC family transcriptional regulator [Paenibacillus nasutitermitis]GGD80311.1 HTH-type transcriptional activator RhaS [Paenibacillus nasutitermitis]